MGATMHNAPRGFVSVLLDALTDAAAAFVLCAAFAYVLAYNIG